jgi:hypothetical protein
MSEDHKPVISEIGTQGNESELGSVINALMISAVIPQVDLRAQIEQILETRRISATMAGDYNKAEDQDRILWPLQMSVQTAQQKWNEASSIDRLCAR